MPASTIQHTTHVRIESAWLAGLYEGEGSLVRRTDARNSSVSWELSITCTDADVIERAHAFTGLGSVTLVRRQRPHWQDKYRWRLGSRDEIAFVLGLLAPHLGQRRKAQVDAFLDWYRRRQSEQHAAPDEVAESQG